jgi:hypothetical protein
MDRVVTTSRLPSTMEYGANVASSLDNTCTLSTTTLASIRVIRLYQGPLLEYPLRERMTNPQANKSIA